MKIKKVEKITSDVKDKLEIIRWVTSLEDDSTIERLKMMKDHPERKDWWDEISDKEKKAIDRGLSDSKAGRVVPHKEAKKIYEKWL